MMTAAAAAVGDAATIRRDPRGTLLPGRAQLAVAKAAVAGAVAPALTGDQTGQAINRTRCYPLSILVDIGDDRRTRSATGYPVHKPGWPRAAPVTSCHSRLAIGRIGNLYVLAGRWLVGRGGLGVASRSGRPRSACRVYASLRLRCPGPRRHLTAAVSQVRRYDSTHPRAGSAACR